MVLFKNLLRKDGALPQGMSKQLIINSKMFDKILEATKKVIMLSLAKMVIEIYSLKNIITYLFVSFNG